MLDKPSFSPWLAGAAPWLAFVAVAVASVLSGGREPIGLLVAVTIPVLLLAARLAGGKEPIRLPAAAIVWWAIPFTAAISQLAGPAPQPVLSEVAFLAALGCALALVSGFSDVDVRRLLTSAFVVGIILLALAIAIRFLGLAGGSLSLEGTFYSTNALAGMLLVLLGPSLWVALSTPAEGSARGVLILRILGAIVSIGIVWALFVTGSRASLVALGVAAVVCSSVLLSQRVGWFRRVAPWLAGLALVSVVIGVVALGAIGHASSQSDAVRTGTVTNGDPVLGGEPRVAYWSGAVALWSSSPIVGHGAGSFAREFPSVQTSVTGFSRDPHSRLMESLAETGTVGFLAFILFFTLVFRRLWLMSVRDRDPFALTGLFVASAFFVHGSLDLQWNVPVTPLAALLIIGATMASGRSYETDVEVAADDEGKQTDDTAESSAPDGISSGPLSRAPGLSPSKVSQVALGVAGALVLLVASLQYASTTQLETAVLDASWGDSSGGLRGLESAQMLDPTTARPHLYRGQERLSKAKAVKEEDGGTPDAEGSRSIAGFLEQAREQAQEAIALDPLDPANHVLLSGIASFEAEGARGGSLVRASRAAERSLAKAYRLDEWNRTSVALSYGELLLAKGARNDAERILLTLTKRYPKKTLALMHSWFGGGLTKEQLNRRTEGAPVLRSELGAYFDTVSDISQAHQHLSSIALSKGLTPDAIVHAEAAAELEPDSTQVDSLLDSLRE